MKIELEDSDIERIAAAVIKGLGTSAPASAPAKAETKGKGKTEAKEASSTTAASAPAEDAEAVKKRRAEILETVVKPLGEKHGRDKVKAIINNYSADGIGAVKASDFDALVAELKKLDEAAEGDDY